MTTSRTEYTIRRPPLAATFDLPSPDRLLKVQPGDQVKLSFSVTERTSEGMWVEVIECCHPRIWRGTLQNEPHHIEDLSVEDDITFHPLDVIDICQFAAIARTDDDGASNMETFHEFCNVVRDRSSCESE